MSSSETFFPVWKALKQSLRCWNEVRYHTRESTRYVQADETNTEDNRSVTFDILSDVNLQEWLKSHISPSYSDTESMNIHNQITWTTMLENVRKWADMSEHQPIWQKTSENEPQCQKTYFLHVRSAKIQIRLRIRAVRSESSQGSLNSYGCKVSPCAQRRLWSDDTGVQVELSLCWTHMWEGTFSQVQAHTINDQSKIIIIIIILFLFFQQMSLTSTVIYNTTV